MAQLIVRNLDDDVRDQLRELAREQGQSVEETVRGILRGAVKAKKKRKAGVGTRLAARFRGQGLSAEIPELRGQTVSPPDFSQ
jgi:plasmid stability protein